MSEPVEVVYKFVVRGVYPNGNKARFDGIIKAPEGFPIAAFEKAVALCQDITPGLMVDTTKGGNVVLTKRKNK